MDAKQELENLKTIAQAHEVAAGIILSPLQKKALRILYHSGKGDMALSILMTHYTGGRTVTVQPIKPR